MNIRKNRLVIGLVIVAWSLAAGCEQTPPNPPSGATSPSSGAGAASQPSAKDLTALRSFVAGDAKQSSPALPAGHPPIPGAEAPRPPRDPAQSAGASSLKFDSPAEWKPQMPRSNMRKAQFALPRAEGDAEDGELVVYYFGPGEGGNVTDNLDRWRSQLTQADGSPLPPDAAKEERFEANGLKVVLLDVSGRYAPGAMPGLPDTGPRDGFRMFAAVIETPGGPWFVKATGPAGTMEQHREAVRKFVASAKP